MFFPPFFLGPGIPLNRFPGVFCVEFTDYHAKRTNGRPNQLNSYEKQVFDFCGMTVWMGHVHCVDQACTWDHGPMGPCLGPGTMALWVHGVHGALGPMGPRSPWKPWCCLFSSLNRRALRRTIFQSNVFFANGLLVRDLETVPHAF